LAELIDKCVRAKRTTVDETRRRARVDDEKK